MERVKVGEGILELKADINKLSAGYDAFQKESISRFDSWKSKLNVITASAFFQIGQQAFQMAKRVQQVMVGMVNDTVQTGAAVYEMSKRFGTSAETISSLGYAARQTETDLEGLLQGIKFISRNAYEASTTNKAMADSFARSGINIRDVNGKLKDGNTLFLEAADVISGLSTQTEKTGVAMEWFGRQGQSLLPILELGSDGIKRLQEESHKLGIGWSTEQAKAADDFADAMQRLSEQMIAMRENAIKPYLKSWTDFTTGLSLTLAKNQEYMKAHEGGVLEWLKKIALYANPATSALTRLYQKIAGKGEWAAIMAPLEFGGGKKAGTTPTATPPISPGTSAALMSIEQFMSQFPAFVPSFTTFTGELEEQGNIWGMVGDNVDRLTEGIWELRDAENAQAAQKIQQLAEEAEAQRQYALQTATNTVQGLGMVAEGMQAIAGNNKALFIFQQMLAIGQMIIDAAAGWGKATAQGGMYGFAVGAAIFAKLMAMVAMMKSQKAPEPPKMRVPGAWEGGVIKTPSIIAVAERNPEVVMPLDKAGMGVDQIEFIITPRDIPDFERQFAIKILRRARQERLPDWKFARA